MKSDIWSLIWNLSEFLHIPLGNFAPLVFEKMIGVKGHCKNKDCISNKIIEILED